MARLDPSGRHRQGREFARMRPSSGWAIASPSSGFGRSLEARLRFHGSPLFTGRHRACRKSGTRHSPGHRRTTTRPGETRGCHLRSLRQGTGLRSLHLSLAPPHQAPLGPQHPAHSCQGRRRGCDPEAPQRVHLLHQGWQGHALTTPHRQGRPPLRVDGLCHAPHPWPSTAVPLR